MKHIPSGDIREEKLLPFRQAFAQSGHGDAYDSARWLYVPDFYAEYRYILGTRGSHPLICVGVNPSTAEPDHLDNTLKSVERIALFNGFDSFLMFNVYARRATRPEDMERTLYEPLHRENMAAFDYILGLSEKPAVWAAWGSVIEQRDYLKRCVQDMIAVGEEHKACWFCAGARSKKGHPHHPLYLRKDSPLEPFAVSDYCQTCL